MTTMSYLNLGVAPRPLDAVYEMLGIDDGLALDFLGNRGLIRDTATPANNRNGSAISPLIFTRASRASYWDADRVLRMAEINEPRIDHDPLTGEPRGLLVEPSGTYDARWPRDLTQGVWVKDFGAQIELVADQRFEHVSLYTASSNSTTSNFYQVATAGFRDSPAVLCAVVKACPDYAGEVEFGTYISSAAATRRTIRFDFMTGAGSTGSGPLLDFGSRPLGDGWFLVWVAHANGPDTNNAVGMRRLGSSIGPVCYVAAMWTERGTHPTSIPFNTDVAATRAADNPSILNGWAQPYFNPEGSTIIVDGMTSAPGIGAVASDVISNISGGASIRIDTSNYIRAALFGQANTIINAGQGLGRGSPMRTAYAWRSGEAAAISVNGAAAFSSAGASIAAATDGDILLGRASGVRYLNGYLRSVTIIPRRLSNAELQEASTL